MGWSAANFPLKVEKIIFGSGLQKNVVCQNSRKEIKRQAKRVSTSVDRIETR